MGLKCVLCNSLSHNLLMELIAACSKNELSPKLNVHVPTWHLFQISVGSLQSCVTIVLLMLCTQTYCHYSGWYATQSEYCNQNHDWTESNNKLRFTQPIWCYSMIARAHQLYVFPCCLVVVQHAQHTQSKISWSIVACVYVFNCHTAWYYTAQFVIYVNVTLGVVIVHAISLICPYDEVK